MSSHDQLCGMCGMPFVRRGDPGCQCALIAKVRADERNGLESWAEVVVRADAAIRAEVLADLRAKVEALHAEALKWQKIREEQGYRETASLFAVEAEAYADVLDLFDGGSDDGA